MANGWLAEQIPGLTYSTKWFGEDAEHFDAVWKDHDGEVRNIDGKELNGVERFEWLWTIFKGLMVTGEWPTEEFRERHFAHVEDFLENFSGDPRDYSFEELVAIVHNGGMFRDAPYRRGVDTQLEAFIELCERQLERRGDVVVG